MKELLNTSTIKFTQSRSGKKPVRAHSTDAGIDFFVPTFNSIFLKDLVEKNQFLLERTSYNGSLVYSNISCNTIGITGTSGGPGCVGASQEESLVSKFIPDSLNILKFDARQNLSYFELYAQQRILMPSGIYCKMQSNNRALIAANKSGVATKTGLIFGAEVVDVDYTGEIHISVINTSSDIVRIYEDMKIIQFIETPIYTSTIEFVDTIEDLYNKITTTRGDKGFGSSDKNIDKLDM